MIPKLIKLDYSHFDKLAFSANLDIPDCDIKDDIKLAGELRQYDPGVGGQNAALRFFFEVREALERSTQSTPQDLGINTTEQSSEALTAVFPNPNPKAWLNGLRFGCITRKLGMPPKMSAWRFGRNSSFLFSPHPTPARRAQEWRHVVPA